MKINCKSLQRLENFLQDTVDHYQELYSHQHINSEESKDSLRQIQLFGDMLETVLSMKHEIKICKCKEEFNG